MGTIRRYQYEKLTGRMVHSDTERKAETVDRIKRLKGERCNPVLLSVWLSDISIFVTSGFKTSDRVRGQGAA